MKKTMSTANPPSSLDIFAKNGWQLEHSVQDQKGFKSFKNGKARLVVPDYYIVEVDPLGGPREEATGEVEEIFSLSKHTAASNRPAVTVQPTGVPHLREGDVPPQGGKPGWPAPPSPQIRPCLKFLTTIAESHNLTVDPASFPPHDVLPMFRWQLGPPFQGITSFKNGEVWPLVPDKGVVEVDRLGGRREEVTGEVVKEIFPISKHTAASNCPALTVHPTVFGASGRCIYLRVDRWTAPPSPQIAPGLEVSKKIAESHNLVPESEVTLEATHHGPETNEPTMFGEIVESPNPGEVSDEVRIEIGKLGVIDGNAATQLPGLQEILKELEKITRSPETDSSAKAGEIILGITGQGAVTLLGYSLSSSQTQKYPSAALALVVAANGIGFIGTLTAIYLRQKRRAAANILGKIGAIFAACGIIGAMGMYLPEKSMIWITAGACLIPVLTVALH